MGNCPRGGIKAHQLTQLTEQTKVTGTRTVAQHERLVGEMCLHRGEEPPVTGINNRRRFLVGTDHPQSLDLSLGNVVLELLKLLLGHGDIHAER